MSTLLWLAFPLSVLWSSIMCILPFRTPVQCVIWKSNFLPVLDLITSHITLSIVNTSIYDISHSTEPSPAATKCLHFTTLFLCYNLTVKIPTCSMFGLLHVFNTITVFLWHMAALMLTWGIGFWIIKWLQITMGSHVNFVPYAGLSWLVQDSNLVNIMDFTL